MEKLFMIATDHGFTLEESLREDFFVGYNPEIVAFIKEFEVKADLGEFLELRSENSESPFLSIIRVTTLAPRFTVIDKLHDES